VSNYEGDDTALRIFQDRQIGMGAQTVPVTGATLNVRSLSSGGNIMVNFFNNSGAAEYRFGQNGIFDFGGDQAASGNPTMGMNNSSGLIIAKPTGDANVSTNRIIALSRLGDAGDIRMYDPSGTVDVRFSALASQVNYIDNGNNLVLGSQSASAKLEVQGDGATDATNTIEFHNSTGTNNAMVIKDDGDIGIGTATPASVAILEITSTTKAFRLTPMTAVQASAITPIEGLQLFVSSTDATFTTIGFWGYENGTWVDF